VVLEEGGAAAVLFWCCSGALFGWFWVFGFDSIKPVRLCLLVFLTKVTHLVAVPEVLFCRRLEVLVFGVLLLAGVCCGGVLGLGGGAVLCLGGGGGAEAVVMLCLGAVAGGKVESGGSGGGGLR
jgi:hypothetical protein